MLQYDQFLFAQVANFFSFPSGIISKCEIEGLLVSVWDILNIISHLFI